MNNPCPRLWSRSAFSSDTQRAPQACRRCNPVQANVLLGPCSRPQLCTVTLAQPSMVQPSPTCTQVEVLLEGVDSKPLARAAAVVKGVTLDRCLVESPANICTPQHLADAAKAIADSAPDCMKCQVGCVVSAQAGQQPAHGACAVPGPCWHPWTHATASCGGCVPRHALLVCCAGRAEPAGCPSAAAGPAGAVGCTCPCQGRLAVSGLHAWRAPSPGSLCTACPWAQVLDQKEIEEMGMGLYLGVSACSDLPPKLIHLTYTPPGAAQLCQLCVLGWKAGLAGPAAASAQGLQGGAAQLQ